MADESKGDNGKKTQAWPPPVAAADIPPPRSSTRSSVDIELEGDEIDVDVDEPASIDKILSRTKEGSGLGLAIVKHVARAHHARVTVDSAPGRGSKFTLVLPAAPPSDEELETPKVREKPSPKPAKKDTRAEPKVEPTVIATSL